MPGTPVKIIEPIESNGAIPVNIQDQHTPPIDALFVQEISAFTLSAPTVASDVSTLQYTFEATAAHGLAPGNEILLIDTTVGDEWSLQAIVKVVSTNTITIDRPIDHVFPSANTLGRITTSNMAVVGSLASPQIFSVRAGANPSDLTRFLLTILSGTTAMDDGKFGNIAALPNGLVFRIVNSFQKTIFNFKTNQDIKQFCYDVLYSPNAPAGNTGLTARISFAGQAKHGVTLRISTGDVVQWVVQDDLTGLTTVIGSVQGHEVTD